MRLSGIPDKQILGEFYPEQLNHTNNGDMAQTDIYIGDKSVSHLYTRATNRVLPHFLGSQFQPSLSPYSLFHPHSSSSFQFQLILFLLLPLRFFPLLSIPLSIPKLTLQTAGTLSSSALTTKEYEGGK